MYVVLMNFILTAARFVNSVSRALYWRARSRGFDFPRPDQYGLEITEK